ncbi:unnamed protein product [Vitrella brassicaformis CCMP3155]|uniref:Telomerase reverse transcriptase n=1 Tax=Vitrella brassicaformis (strain CCMP3155) TaxID=1169540 RepID=A0A0G4FK71_VITBC|nr:unnamed protein product [Vitrella brassicaformis CCMP3155]|eukprot:CEM14175.1 unnamed protein product [Vitrella brassicaformis CCMP3155]
MSVHSDLSWVTSFVGQPLVSLEDYLEGIYRLKRQHASKRSITIRDDLPQGGAVREGDAESYVTLMRRSVVFEDAHFESPYRRELTKVSLAVSSTQNEVYKRAVLTVLQSQRNRSPSPPSMASSTSSSPPPPPMPERHSLALPYRLHRSNPRQLECKTPTTMATWMTSGAWKTLLSRCGDSVMLHLLINCVVFCEVPPRGEEDNTKRAPIFLQCTGRLLTDAVIADLRRSRFPFSLATPSRPALPPGPPAAAAAAAASLPAKRKHEPTKDESPATKRVKREERTTTTAPLAAAQVAQSSGRAEARRKQRRRSRGGRYKSKNRREGGGGDGPSRPGRPMDIFVPRHRIFFAKSFSLRPGLPRDSPLEKHNKTEEGAKLLTKYVCFGGELFQRPADAPPHPPMATKATRIQCKIARRLGVSVGEILSNYHANKHLFPSLLRRTCPATHAFRAIKGLPPTAADRRHQQPHDEDDEMSGARTVKADSCTPTEPASPGEPMGDGGDMAMDGDDGGGADDVDERVRRRFPVLSCEVKPSQVVRFVMTAFRLVFPSSLWGGVHNTRVILRRVRQFVTLNRQESFNLPTLLHRLELKPIALRHGIAKCSKDQLKLLQDYYGRLVYFALTHFVVPVLRAHFFITPAEPSGQRVRFFRKAVWHRLHRHADAALRKVNLEPIYSSSASPRSKLKKGYRFPSVRWLPKLKGMRPVVNLSKGGTIPAPPTVSGPSPPRALPSPPTPPSNALPSPTSLAIVPRPAQPPPLASLAVPSRALYVADHMPARRPQTGSLLPVVPSSFAPMARLSVNYHLRTVQAAVRWVAQECADTLGRSVLGYGAFAAALREWWGEVCRRAGGGSGSGGDLPKLDVVVGDLTSCYESISQQELVEAVDSLPLPDQLAVVKVLKRSFSPPARFVTRTLTVVLPMDRFPDLRSALRDPSHGAHSVRSAILSRSESHGGILLSDPCKVTILTKTDLLATIKHHITHHAVKLQTTPLMDSRGGRGGRGRNDERLLGFRQHTGIPQGGTLSPLLCAIHYGRKDRSVDLKALLNLFKAPAPDNAASSSPANDPIAALPALPAPPADNDDVAMAPAIPPFMPSFLIRWVDDFLFLCPPDRGLADGFLSLLLEREVWGGPVNRHKCRANFNTALLDGGHGEGEAEGEPDDGRIDWAGLALEPGTGEGAREGSKAPKVNALFSGWKFPGSCSISDSLNIMTPGYSSFLEGALDRPKGTAMQTMIEDRVRGFMRIKLSHAMLLDRKLNDWQTICRNVYFVMRVTFMKLVAASHRHRRIFGGFWNASYLNNLIDRLIAQSNQFYRRANPTATNRSIVGSLNTLASICELAFADVCVSRADWAALVKTRRRPKGGPKKKRTKRPKAAGKDNKDGSGSSGLSSSATERAAEHLRQHVGGVDRGKIRREWREMQWETVRGVKRPRQGAREGEGDGDVSTEVDARRFGVPLMHRTAK